MYDQIYALDVYGVVIEKNKINVKKTKIQREKLSKDGSYKLAHYRHFHRQICVNLEEWNNIKNPIFPNSNSLIEKKV